MRRRYKRRGRLTKLLYVLVALFLLSLWNFYRQRAGIFYLHIGLVALLIAVLWSVDCHLSRKYKKKQHALWGSTRYTKSKVGQSTTLRRLRARLKLIKGYEVEPSVRVRRSSRKKS